MGSNRENFGISYSSSKKLRTAFREAQEGYCFYCENLILEGSPQPGEKNNHYMSIDHVVPRSQQGCKFSIANMIGACCQCNAKRSSNSLESYFNGRKAQLRIKEPRFKLEDIPVLQEKAFHLFVGMFTEDETVPQKVIKGVPWVKLSEETI
jgi:hypothetical protein